MGMSRRVFSREFNVAAVNELKSGKTRGFCSSTIGSERKHSSPLAGELDKHPTKAFQGTANEMLDDIAARELCHPDLL